MLCTDVIKFPKEYDILSGIQQLQTCQHTVAEMVNLGLAKPHLLSVTKQTSSKPCQNPGTALWRYKGSLLVRQEFHTPNEP
jgi:hypothetical protein